MKTLTKLTVTNCFPLRATTTPKLPSPQDPKPQARGQHGPSWLTTTPPTNVKYWVCLKKRDRLDRSHVAEDGRTGAPGFGRLGLVGAAAGSKSNRHGVVRRASHSELVLTLACLHVQNPRSALHRGPKRRGRRKIWNEDTDRTCCHIHRVERTRALVGVVICPARRPPAATEHAHKGPAWLGVVRPGVPAAASRRFEPPHQGHERHGGLPWCQRG